VNADLENDQKEIREVTVLLAKQKTGRQRGGVCGGRQPSIIKHASIRNVTAHCSRICEQRSKQIA
jgi:hypothetical protein